MNQQEIIERIQKARSPEPTETVESPTESEAIETTEVVEAETLTDEVASPEQSDETEELSEETIEDEELYVILNEREIPLSQIEEWEQGNLRQKDYTLKTQKLAEQRKELEAKANSITEKASKLDDVIAELETVKGEKESSIDWEELREYDPSEYLKQRELQEKREAALTKAKQERGNLSQEQVQAKAEAELERLIQANPQWIDKGKETEVYKQDMDRVRSYLNDLGLSEQEQSGILLSGHGQAYLDAAKFHLGKKSNAAVTKKVRTAPVVTKPGGARQSKATTELQRAIKAHKQHGTVETAMRVRKARQTA